MVPQNPYSLLGSLKMMHLALISFFWFCLMITEVPEVTERKKCLKPVCRLPTVLDYQFFSWHSLFILDYFFFVSENSSREDSWDQQARMSTLSGRDKQSKGTVCINVNKKININYTAPVLGWDHGWPLLLHLLKKKLAKIETTLVDRVEWKSYIIEMSTIYVHISFTPPPQQKFIVSIFANSGELSPPRHLSSSKRAVIQP